MYKPLGVQQRRGQGALWLVVAFIFIFLIYRILRNKGLYEEPVYPEPGDEVVDKKPESLAAKGFIFAPAECPKNNFIMMVHIRVDDFDRRNEWRFTYGSFTKLFNFTLFFAVGYPQNRSLYPRLQQEQEKYGDMIMGNHIDHYDNMTLKHLSHLRYYNEKCTETKYLVKVDDDVAVNVVELSSFISSIYEGSAPWFGMDTSYGPKMWCRVWTRAVVQRSAKYKWAVPRSRWNKKHWPDYCAGMGYITTREAVSRLVKAAKTEKWLWVDDIFVTGILAQKGQVQLVEAAKFFSLDEDNELPFVWGNAMFALTWRNETWNFFDIVN